MRVDDGRRRRVKARLMTGGQDRGEEAAWIGGLRLKP